MKLEVHCDYDDEVITDCDMAKAICELCGKESRLLNPRKIAQIILLCCKDYEQIWVNLLHYVEQSKIIDKGNLLAIMNCMEGKYE